MAGETVVPWENSAQDVGCRVHPPLAMRLTRAAGASGGQVGPLTHLLLTVFSSLPRKAGDKCLLGTAVQDRQVPHQLRPGECSAEGARRQPRSGFYEKQQFIL